MNIKQFFHYISYLQYPLILIALYFGLKPYFNGFQLNFDDINNCLIFLGMGISFSTFQDTTKTQNKLSLKVWESPRKGKIFLGFLGFMIVFLITLGLFGIYRSNNENLQEVSFGLIVLSIGLMGMLKAAKEMFENHRLDKNPKPNP